MMKSNGYLLDTSILVSYIQEDPEVLRHISIAEGLYMSTVAIGELYYGAERSINVAKGLADVHKLEQLFSILAVDLMIARTYGRLRHDQNKKRRSLPANDLWIAATALRHGLTLVAKDNHFTWIDTLSLEQW